MAHILIVEDNEIVSRLLARLLRHQGHTVDTRDSGEAALTFLQNTLPHLIILDLMMPGMDGNEVLRRVRDDPRTAALPVIVHTAIADETMRDHVLTKGAQDYWVKASLDLSEMTKRLNNLLAA